MSGADQSEMPEVWDAETQQPHGGQEWRFLPNFVADFSVTLNSLPPPGEAMAAARESLQTICHYPPGDMEPTRTELARFLWPDLDPARQRGMFLLGNGASELIDLVVRDARPGPWKPGPATSQYMEYERAATAYGRQTVPWDDPDAPLTCLVNPNNPTGDWWTRDRVLSHIERYCNDGSTVLVDESMLMWHGPQWRDHSLLSAMDQLGELRSSRDIRVWIMHSWTKIWSCPGLRLGSVIGPSAADVSRLKRVQVPWSVNTPALAFLGEAVKDTAYMEEVWAVTPGWRAHLVAGLERDHPEWSVHGEPFLSWVWVDTGSEATALDAVAKARAAGLPIRHGAPGFAQPECIRIGVREPGVVDQLLAAIR